MQEQSQNGTQVQLPTVDPTLKAILDALFLAWLQNGAYQRRIAELEAEVARLNATGMRPVNARVDEHMRIVTDDDVTQVPRTKR
jgi:hypothetical protein